MKGILLWSQPHMIIEKKLYSDSDIIRSRNPKLAYKVINIFEMHRRTNQMKYNNAKSRVYH